MGKGRIKGSETLRKISQGKQTQNLRRKQRIRKRIIK
jgi:hypothetical protein